MKRRIVIKNTIIAILYFAIDIMFLIKYGSTKIQDTPGIPIAIAAVSLILCILHLIVAFNCGTGSWIDKPIMLSFRTLKKYINVAPEKYIFNPIYVSYKTRIIRKDQDYDETYNIYFKTIFGHILCFIYFALGSHQESNNDMKKYLKHVQNDVQSRIKESEKQIKKAMKTQKEILDRMNTSEPIELKIDSEITEK